MHYCLNFITMSFTIAIKSITCITASIIYQKPKLPSPSPPRLSHALQSQSYIKVHHHRHHVYHMHYNFNPITMSVTIAIMSITYNTDLILQQCPSPSPSCLSYALQLKSYNKVHQNGHHVHHMPYGFNPITMSITIAIPSFTCITASILKQCPSPSPSRQSQELQLQSYNNVQFFHDITFIT